VQLTAVECHVAAGAKPPLLADDLFINYDGNHVCACLVVPAELTRAMQMPIFAHHRHFAGIAPSSSAPTDRNLFASAEQLDCQVRAGD